MAAAVRPALAPRVSLVGLLAVVLAGPLAAQDPTPLVVRYKELTNREQFRFAIKDGKGDKKDYARAVGSMQFEFPVGTFPSEGLDQTYKSYCIEPLTPMYAGQTYAFAVQPFGEPKDFPGLKNNAAGKETALKRADYVKELYGKHYKDSLDDPVKGPAFQVALWELLEETEFPEGPAPFNLLNGSFTSNYGNAALPVHVQAAQTMLQGLTGDATVYTENPAFANTEIVRLTGTANFGLRAQSQLAVRNIPPVVGGGGPLAGGLGLGGLGGGLPIANYGGGGSGGGGFGGGAIGFPFFPLLGGSGGGGSGGGSGTGSGTGTGTAATGTATVGTATSGTGITNTIGTGSLQSTGTISNGTISTGTTSTSGNDNSTTPGTPTTNGPGIGTNGVTGTNTSTIGVGGTSGTGTGTGTIASGTATGTTGGPGTGGNGPGTAVPAPPGLVLGLGAVALMLVRRRAARNAD